MLLISYIDSHIYHHHIGVVESQQELEKFLNDFAGLLETTWEVDKNMPRPNDQYYIRLGECLLIVTTLNRADPVMAQNLHKRLS